MMANITRRNAALGAGALVSAGLIGAGPAASQPPAIELSPIMAAGRRLKELSDLSPDEASQEECEIGQFLVDASPTGLPDAIILLMVAAAEMNGTISTTMAAMATSGERSWSAESCTSSLGWPASTWTAMEGRIS